MKYRIFLVGILLGINSVFAQSDKGSMSELGRISIRPMVKNTVSIDDASKKLLINRLTGIINHSGAAGADSYTQFVLIADFTVADKAIAMNINTVQTIEYVVNFFLTDVVNKRVFATTEIRIKGVGETEQKAMSNALKSISEKDTRITVMLQRGKDRIMEFYSGECERIMANIEELKNMGQHLLAFATLANMPETSGDCYERSGLMLGELYMEVSRNNCMERENMARMHLEKKDKKKALYFLELLAQGPCKDRLDNILSTDKLLTQEEKNKFNSKAGQNVEPVHEPQKVRARAPVELKITTEEGGAHQDMFYQDQEFLNNQENFFPE